MRREDIIDAIRAAGLSPPDVDFKVEGEDPFFRSPLRLATGASAALVMMGSAVDRIWQARGGRPQSVSIDAQHAALSLLSMWLLKIDGELATSRLAGERGINLSGQYQCSDGRLIHLQPGFPHHQRRILDTLGCAADRDALSEAIATAEAEPLETALSEAGVPAVIVRDWRTWQQTEQGIAMKAVPAVEIEKIDDAPPMPFDTGSRPLEGVRVLDLTRVLAGPTCARLLGEQGADVLHVDGPELPDLRPGQADTSHGKRMTFIDLDDPAGKEKLTGLAGSADVFVQSYRAGSLRRRGLGPEDLARLRPGIIYVSVNCYGHHGPWQSRAGYDGNAMAATGIQMVHREQPAPGIAVAMNDYCTAYWGAYGAMTALALRAQQGGSWHVQISLTQSAMWFLRMGTPFDRALGHSPETVREIAERYLVREQSPYGELSQLAPALGMSVTPPHWSRGTPTPGSSEPVWL